jgi:hypothetical protein
MAKTLFFIEAFLFAALAVAFPIIASEAAAAFIIPAAISLVLPFACAIAVWPPRSVLRAVRSAFSSRGSGSKAVEFARILEGLGSFSRAAAALGFLFSITAACRELPFSGNLKVWTLLGTYLSAYALLNAMLWRILAAVVERSAGRAPEREAPVEAALHEAFASAYGLTPREMETAARIARGSSYKPESIENKSAR